MHIPESGSQISLFKNKMNDSHILSQLPEIGHFPVAGAAYLQRHLHVPHPQLFLGLPHIGSVACNAAGIECGTSGLGLFILLGVGAQLRTMPILVALSYTPKKKPAKRSGTDKKKFGFIAFAPFTTYI